MQQSLRICFIWADKIAHSRLLIPIHMQLWNGIYQTIVAFGLEGVFARLPSRTVVYFVYAPSAVRPVRWKSCATSALDGGRVALLRDQDQDRTDARERVPPMQWHRNGLPCDGTRTDAHSSNRKASRHPIGWPFLSCRLGKMRCATIALGYCISIFFGCNSGRFFIVTVSIPFSILAVRVARSALSGISALMA